MKLPFEDLGHMLQNAQAKMYAVGQTAKYILPNIRPVSISLARLQYSDQTSGDLAMMHVYSKGGMEIQVGDFFDPWLTRRDRVLTRGYWGLSPEFFQNENHRERIFDTYKEEFLPLLDEVNEELKLR